MSFILEALRKSEAERRRGQTPDLLSDALPVAPAARVGTDNRGRIIVIVAVSLLVLLLGLWAFRPTVPAESKAAATPPPVPAITTVAVPPLSTPASLSPPPARASLPATQAPAPAPPAAALRTAATPSTAPQTRELQPEPAESEAIAPPAAPPQVATAEPASTATFASPEVPLKLADLSTDEREQLPVLKVSMHMWAPDAANRFAIIDGVRLNEGDRVGDAIVEAIQPDGVMLSWRGRRIRLPIR